MNEFERALLRYFSEEQLARIQKVRVGIAGAGGLGSNCAWNLARCGFRRFVLCDFDAVELSNLNRQFYFADQAGLPKVEALAANLRRINADAEITPRRQRLTGENAGKAFAGCDAVVEAFDNAPDKKMLAEAYACSGKFYVSASGLAGWGNSDAIVVRKVNESFCLVGDGESAVSPQRPPCSPRVNVAAAKQADCILAWVLG
ncbi:MAG: sulfur carrier protein ThiS adenylyltransferase ThiF [Endomicrobiales bacterium]